MRKMKDSGIEWIGEIPESWEIVKLKRVASIMTGNTPTKTKDNEFYSQQEGYMWIKAEDLGNNLPIEKTTEYLTPEGIQYGRLFPPKTVYVCCIASVGKVGYCEKEASCNQQINGIIFEGMHWKYGYYMTIAQENEYSVNASGNVMKILNTEKQSMFNCPYPSLDTQIRISQYLDKKCAKIDAIIATKEKVNELLKERRQSVIYEAVTKGLDSNAPMKDSGIEWIGKVPEKWDTTRIKFTSTLKGRIGWQGLKSDEYISEGPYLITGVDFENGLINWDNCAHISKERFDEAPEIHILEGDLLITKDGTIGKVAIAENCPKEVSLNSGVLLIRNKNENRYTNKYLYYVLLSDVFWKWFKISQNGNSTIIHLYQEQFSNFVYPLPSVQEQNEIVEQLEKKCAEIDALISANNSTIEKLKEYRQSIIYEAVTGKVEI